MHADLGSAGLLAPSAAASILIGLLLIAGVSARTLMRRVAELRAELPRSPAITEIAVTVEDGWMPASQPCPHRICRAEPVAWNTSGRRRDG
jgi:hypothetical protein